MWSQDGNEINLFPVMYWLFNISWRKLVLQENIIFGYEIIIAVKEYCCVNQNGSLSFKCAIYFNTKQCRSSNNMNKNSCKRANRPWLKVHLHQPQSIQNCKYHGDLKWPQNNIVCKNKLINLHCRFVYPKIESRCHTIHQTKYFPTRGYNGMNHVISIKILPRHNF